MEEKAPSGCPAHIEDSSESGSPPRNPSLLIESSRRSFMYDRRRDGLANVAHILGAEQQRPDGEAAVAEHRVVGADLGEPQPCLLQREEVLDRLRRRAVPILDRGVELA